MLLSSVKYGTSLNKCSNVDLIKSIVFFKWASKHYEKVNKKFLSWGTLKPISDEKMTNFSCAGCIESKNYSYLKELNSPSWTVRRMNWNKSFGLKLLWNINRINLTTIDLTLFYKIGYKELIWCPANIFIFLLSYTADTVDAYFTDLKT